MYTCMVYSLVDFKEVTAAFSLLGLSSEAEPSGKRIGIREGRLKMVNAKGHPIQTKRDVDLSNITRARYE